MNARECHHADGLYVPEIGDVRTPLNMERGTRSDISMEVMLRIGHLYIAPLDSCDLRKHCWSALLMLGRVHPGAYDMCSDDLQIIITSLNGTFT